MPPNFLFFDLGKVLINFSTERMLEQMGAVAGVAPDRVRKVLFGDGLMQKHETGRLDSRGMHEAFCTATGSRPDYDALVEAATDIFELNLPMMPLVTQLEQAGYPMGILSNTGETHWNHCFRRYRIVSEKFAVHALSFRIGTVKPDVAIFHAAAKLAGHKPEEILFIDDRIEHVVGAQAAGFDAVQFTAAEALAGELRQRGIRFNC